MCAYTEGQSSKRKRIASGPPSSPESSTWQAKITPSLSLRFHEAAGDGGDLGPVGLVGVDGLVAGEVDHGAEGDLGAGGALSAEAGGGFLPARGVEVGGGPIDLVAAR